MKLCQYRSSDITNTKSNTITNIDTNTNTNTNWVGQVGENKVSLSNTRGAGTHFAKKITPFLIVINKLHMYKDSELLIFSNMLMYNAFSLNTSHHSVSILYPLIRINLPLITTRLKLKDVPWLFLVMGTYELISLIITSYKQYLCGYHPEDQL